jgi:phosphatidylserine/phosphatidylglycerophosphate/cardiolipin synthase-like enzyme
VLPPDQSIRGLSANLRKKLNRKHFTNSNIILLGFAKSAQPNLHFMNKFLIFLILIFSPLLSYASPFEANATYDVCFTPGGNCTQDIINTISSAQQSIYVQAYSFTSRPIEKALVSAKKRGLIVDVIFDKSILEHSGTAWFFIRNHIPVWIDSNPAIAHNKVMIIDEKKVITGSFNFTYAAQEKNAENVLIIKDSELANKYLNAWQERKSASKQMSLSSLPSTKSDWMENSQHWMLWELKKLLRT